MGKFSDCFLEERTPINECPMTIRFNTSHSHTEVSIVQWYALTFQHNDADTDPFIKQLQDMVDKTLFLWHIDHRRRPECKSHWPFIGCSRKQPGDQWFEGKTVSDLDSANSIAALSETAHTIYSPSCMRPAHQQPALESASTQKNKQTKHWEHDSPDSSTTNNCAHWPAMDLLWELLT